MTVTPEDIMAYIDGEADAKTRERVAAAAKSDPEVQNRIAREQRLRDELRAHFAAPEAEMPPAWEAMIRAAAAPGLADVVDLAQARAEREASALPSRPSLWRSAWIGGAIAASLALGLFMGTQNRPDELFSAEGGTLVAQGRLARALDTQLASTQGGAAVRLLATFRNDKGILCRAFTGAQASGIACRSGQGWQLQHILPGSTADSAQYRQAGSQDAELMALAQQMAVGDQLDAAEEKTAKALGWR